MDAKEFESLAVGDKVCITFRPEYWGYIEDIDRKIGIVEFDIEEAVDTAPEQTEIKVSYNHVKILAKGKIKDSLDIEVTDELVRAIADKLVIESLPASSLDNDVKDKWSPNIWTRITIKK